MRRNNTTRGRDGGRGERQKEETEAEEEVYFNFLKSLEHFRL